MFVCKLSNVSYLRINTCVSISSFLVRRHRKLSSIFFCILNSNRFEFVLVRVSLYIEHFSLIYKHLCVKIIESIWEKMATRNVRFPRRIDESALNLIPSLPPLTSARTNSRSHVFDLRRFSWPILSKPCSNQPAYLYLHLYAQLCIVVAKHASR